MHTVSFDLGVQSRDGRESKVHRTVVMSALENDHAVWALSEGLRRNPKAADFGTVRLRLFRRGSYRWPSNRACNRGRSSEGRRCVFEGKRSLGFEGAPVLRWIWYFLSGIVQGPQVALLLEFAFLAAYLQQMG